MNHERKAAYFKTVFSTVSHPSRVLAEGACRYKSVYITDHHDKQYNLDFTANTGPDINSKLTRIYVYLYSDTLRNIKLFR